MDANHQQTTKEPQEDLEMQHKSETGGERQHAGCAAQSPSNKKDL